MVLKICRRFKIRLFQRVFHIFKLNALNMLLIATVFFRMGRENEKIKLFKTDSISNITVFILSA